MALKLFHLKVDWLIEAFSALTCALVGFIELALAFRGSTLLAKPRLCT